MPADDFFIGPMLTSIGRGECVRAVRFPVWPHRRVGTGFFEISARRSDFAFVAAAAQVALDEEGRCLDIALGLGGVADRPMRLDVSSARRDQARCGVGVRCRQCRLRRHRCDERSARQRRLSPPRRGDARRPRARTGARQCRRQTCEGARDEGRVCASTAKTAPPTSSRARRCSMPCARISCSTAPMPAASTASAAPARCCSMASRCAPA